MNRKQAMEKYGEEMFKKMGKSKYMQDITISLNEDGTIDIPDGDLERAYRDVNGGKIHFLEVD